MIIQRRTEVLRYRLWLFVLFDALKERFSDDSLFVDLIFYFGVYFHLGDLDCFIASVPTVMSHIVRTYGR